MKSSTDESRGPSVRGFWHDPVGEQKGALVLTHGAGANASAPLLVAVAGSFAEAGWVVLRYDLPFRQMRPHGPPLPAMAAQDRAGIENAVRSVRDRGWTGRLVVAGHSYGGRQASMLAAEKPEIADALVLLAYPLHPPRKPEQLRTAHFPNLRMPALFVHGARDPFGTREEFEEAIRLIPARTQMMEIEGAGHDLKPFGWLKNFYRQVTEFIGG
jgi:predicted alpha/beta-hydrolase family hydrolase